MIPDLRSSRGESTTSKIGFYPGHLEGRLTGGTQRTTGLMVRYEVVNVSRLLSRKEGVEREYCRAALQRWIAKSRDINRLLYFRKDLVR